MNRYVTPLIFAISLITVRTFSQTHLTVPLHDSVYHILDVAQVRGAVQRISSVRPFTNSTILGHLEQIRLSRALSVGREAEILDSVYRRHAYKASPFRFDFSVDANPRTDLLRATDYHLFSAYEFKFLGDVADSVSYRVFVSPTIDRVNGGAFAPFRFTKRWEGTHVSVTTGEHFAGNTDALAVSQASYPELAVSAIDETLFLRWAKIRRNWGVGESSLQLSGTATSFDAVEGSLMLAPWVRLSFLTGSLANSREKDTTQAMISTKRVEFFFTDWLYLALFDSLIWGKRLELYYLNPFGISVLAQSAIGDMDNVLIGGTVSATLSPYVQAYFSVMIDDYRIDNITPFTHPLWKFALQAGLKAPIPYVPLGLVTFQYTKIEPWMYTHYPQQYPFLTEKTNISYVHAGEHLGYYLPPNTDEFLLKLKAMPLSFLIASLQYQYIRHGDGDLSLGQVEGDINKPQRWDLGLSLADLPHKDFLNDAVYEFIHILTMRIDLEFDLGFVKLELGPEYSYVKATNFETIEGNNVVKHLLGFNLFGSLNMYTYGK